MKGTHETCYRQKAVGSPEQKFRDLQGGAQAQFYQVSGRDKPIPLGLTQQKSTGGQQPNPQLKESHLVSTESMDEHNKGFMDLMLDCIDPLMGWCQSKQEPDFIV